MAVNHYFNVFSNDGSTTLFTSANTVNNSTIITVTETGLTIGTETYTYSGTKKFIGVSGLANSTSPDYAIGESFDGGEDSVYIVEEEPATSAVTVEYNGLVIATIPNGKMATVSCNGKKMTTDVIIEVPMATDSPIPTEVSTEAEMTALLTSGEVGGVYKYTGTTGTYENGALYVLEEEAESIVGTWVFNSYLNKPYTSDTIPYIVDFKSDNKTFYSMRIVSTDNYIGKLYYCNANDDYYAYNFTEVETSGTFTDEAYRTIEIINEPTDTTFIEWLKANATKQ